VRILPVIDLLYGRVVRGIAGRRSEYRPIQSRWTDSSEPLAVAAALEQAFGFRRFYIADLDGILAQRPQLDLYRKLADLGYELLIDAGIRVSEDAQQILDSGAAAAIIGLETLSSVAMLAELVDRHSAEQIIFSLDLQAGRTLIAAGADWTEPTPSAIAAEAYRGGIRRMIVLDLADVGSNTGGSTLAFCEQLRATLPDLKLISGGGVRGRDDIARWSHAGIEDLLVASALHDGRLMPDDVRNGPGDAVAGL